MKYTPDLYAKAFLATVGKASGKRQEELLRNFLKVVKKNGDWPLVGKIFQKVKRAEVSARGGRIVTLEIARELSQDILQKLKNNFSPNDLIITQVRPELIAGVRILIDEEKQLDASLRQKLRKLFVK